jgi:hypothetical protein
MCVLPIASRMRRHAQQHTHNALAHAPAHARQTLARTHTPRQAHVHVQTHTHASTPAHASTHTHVVTAYTGTVSNLQLSFIHIFQHRQYLGIVFSHLISQHLRIQRSYVVHFLQNECVVTLYSCYASRNVIVIFSLQIHAGNDKRWLTVVGINPQYRCIPVLCETPYTYMYAK